MGRRGGRCLCMCCHAHVAVSRPLADIYDAAALRQFLVVRPPRSPAARACCRPSMLSTWGRVFGVLHHLPGFQRSSKPVAQNHEVPSLAPLGASTRSLPYVFWIRVRPCGGRYGGCVRRCSACDATNKEEGIHAAAMPSTARERWCRVLGGTVAEIIKFQIKFDAHPNELVGTKIALTTNAAAEDFAIHLDPAGQLGDGDATLGDSLVDDVRYLHP